MDSVRPSIVAQQNQAPPPYYPASGLENKALEHSMDLALTLEDQKAAVYATQNGYGYHQQQSLQVPGQHIPNSECKYHNPFRYRAKIIYLLNTTKIYHVHTDFGTNFYIRNSLISYTYLKWLFNMRLWMFYHILLLFSVKILIENTGFAYEKWSRVYIVC